MSQRATCVSVRAPNRSRVGWLREGRRQLEERRRAEAGQIPRSRAERVKLARRRLEEELASDRVSNEAYEYYRTHARDAQGRGLGAPPKRFELPETPAGKVNVTDPDSKQIKTNAGFGWVQGYNAQTVVGEGHIVLAAEVVNNTNDWSQLDPMVSAALAELERAGVTEKPKVATADTGYWRDSQIDEVVANKHIQVLIPPDAGNRTGPRPGWTQGRPAMMRRVLRSERGRELYRRRKQMIEPVFAHTKHNRGISSFHRRGLKAVRTEWRLLMTTHNLAKLHRHQTAQQHSKPRQRSDHRRTTRPHATSPARRLPQPPGSVRQPRSKAEASTTPVRPLRPMLLAHLGSGV